MTEGVEFCSVGVLTDECAALIGDSLRDAYDEVRRLFERFLQVFIELLYGLSPSYFLASLEAAVSQPAWRPMISTIVTDFCW